MMADKKANKGRQQLRISEETMAVKEGLKVVSEYGRPFKG